MVDLEYDYKGIPTVYILLLEGDNYYIGYSMNLEERLKQHFNGAGAKWTKLHKPVKIIDIMPYSSKEQERIVTLEYMRCYGYKKVRGAAWCQTYNYTCPVLIRPFKQ